MRGPVAFARLIGSPSLAEAARRQPALLERAVGDAGCEQVTPAQPASDGAHFTVLDEGGELLVLAELPAMGAWELRVYAYADQLSIHLRATGRCYTHPLPATVDTASLRTEFNDGILVVTLAKRR